MASKIVIAALVCLVGMGGMAAAQNYQTYPSQLYPVNQRSSYTRPVAQLPPLNAYELHVVPSSAMAEYESPTELTIWDYILTPSTALAYITSTAISVTDWTLSNASAIILGMALVIGFCAFTPYCTLVLEGPLARQIRSLSIPYLDDVEYYVKQAFGKYHGLQYED